MKYDTLVDWLQCFTRLIYIMCGSVCMVFVVNGETKIDCTRDTLIQR